MKREHETKIPVIVETESGAIESTIDLAKLSDAELVDLIPQVPLAMVEYHYRFLSESSNDA